jgi:hypothetical protein
MESLIEVLFISLLSLLNISLQLGEELFNRTKIRRVGWQV